MKATQKNFAAQMTRAAAEASVFYFCGPDEAGASDAAARLSAHIRAQQCTFERAELAGRDLRSYSVLRADIVRSVSLFRDNLPFPFSFPGAHALYACNTLSAPLFPLSLVFLFCPPSPTYTCIAKLLSDRPDALVTMFHPPDPSTVTTAVREMADRAGLRLSNDLAERIARGAALDTRMARSEIEKLALFLDASPQAPRTADAAALDAIGATSEDDSFTPLVNTVLAGDTQRLSTELARMHELELNPVGLLLAFERRAAQLAQLAGRLRGRSDINAFLEQEMAARRVFFRDKADLAQQLRRWRGRKLARLIERLVQLHCQLLADSRNSELVISQGLAEIGRAASR